MSHTGSNVEEPLSGDVAYLSKVVPLMRELGVTAYGSIVLGPDPKAASVPRDPELSDDERMNLARKTAAEREQRMRFGMSGGPRPLGPHDR